jgi:hypothetical protein
VALFHDPLKPDGHYVDLSGEADVVAAFVVKT